MSLPKQDLSNRAPCPKLDQPCQIEEKNYQAQFLHSLEDSGHPFLDHTGQSQ
jgi:hypothetical protein